MQLKIDNYDKMVPELLKAFAEPGTGIAESMLDFRHVLEDQLRRFPVGEFCPYGTLWDIERFWHTIYTIHSYTSVAYEIINYYKL